jgi:hypothetical protein
LKRPALIIFIIFSLSHSLIAQDSCGFRISLLTCGPGEELYATFGHTAIRVQDKSTGEDEVYNYGTFDFGPDFYMKFIRGKLLYYLSVENFNNFMFVYQEEGRTVRDQVLLLNCEEKQSLVTALHVNALPQNRFYKYDFLFDNCTTRAKEIVAKNTFSPVHFNNILPSQIPSFRQLIHSYLKNGKEYWSMLGIDILLGANLDKKVTNEQSMFLPDYLLRGFDNASVQGHPLAGAPQTILPMPAPHLSDSIFTPLPFFIILLLFIIGLSINAVKPGIINIFDFILFAVSGIAGILILFMWFGRDDQVCRNNYNLLWALPTNLFMAFFVHKSLPWVRKYFRFVMWVSIFLALFWFFLPQEMNIGLLPIIFLIIFRCWQLSKPNRNATKNNLISK